VDHRLGFFLANLAGNTIRTNASQYAERLAIIALAIAMGLHQMGFGEEIINLAFGLRCGREWPAWGMVAFSPQRGGRL